jgi:hypothetical protein
MDTKKNTNQILEESTIMSAGLPEEVEKERETDLRTKIKANKKTLILAAIGIVGVVAVAGGICFIRNKKTAVDVFALPDEIPKRIALDVDEAVYAEVASSKRPYSRPTEPFIRTMAEWKHHSAAKEAQAAELGINLKSNQTIVDFSKKAA